MFVKPNGCSAVKDNVYVILKQLLIRVAQTELALKHVSRHGNHLLSKVWLVFMQVFKELKPTQMF